MWKLTITQKRKSEFYGNEIEEKIEILSDDLNELTMMIVRFEGFKSEKIIIYKIEKVGASNE